MSSYTHSVDPVLWLCELFPSVFCILCSLVYQTAAKLKEEPYRGRASVYDGGGYTLQLPTDDDDKLRVLIDKLRATEYIDAGTRAVFLDFTAYNPNENLFAVVR